MHLTRRDSQVEPVEGGDPAEGLAESGDPQGDFRRRVHRTSLMRHGHRRIGDGDPHPAASTGRPPVRPTW
ncbi:hypothetical protein Apa02nite_042640 [Actinoplanes palleronii]|uniref:Uncharacterized protein n=1 Tax=Actinoplanes palleronii TaxID=113570 RepID=A0ABQ4BCQ3_9ACTN|nr:hypothetical protein Apa02nite_042640 [Actinoplanes palleronii]